MGEDGILSPYYFVLQYLGCDPLNQSFGEHWLPAPGA